ncbi:hypothetical protein BZL30_4716 [Mycobacterium kansasii]|uniref:Uncharacterized protein n=1 Tax=Mycobacterium kansasii TaxID=1768 RepID=A0A1V3X3U4_MYCKA|nr:hypothetical protein BZL30_4716 [Mycobacterium kansasii]
MISRPVRNIGFRSPTHGLLDTRAADARNQLRASTRKPGTTNVNDVQRQC